MKNYTDIVLDDRPEDVKIVEYIESVSGLPQNVCQSLLQRAKLNESWNPKTYKEFWDEYFEVSKPVDLDDFVNDVVNYVKEIGDTEDNDDTAKRRQKTQQLLGILKQYMSVKDTPSVLEVICCMLAMKDGSTGKNLMESVRFGSNAFKNLCESDCFDLPTWNSLNILSTNYSKVNDINRDEDIYFYNELKYLLDERFRDYSSQPRDIRNVYDTIMQYVVNKIEDLQSMQMMRQSDENQYSQMIESIIKTSQLDPRYLSPDFLKTITSDFQTMLFDLTVIINSYVMQVSRKYGNYVDPFKYEEYFVAFESLSKVIASSCISSYLVNNNCCKCCCADGKELDHKSVNSMNGSIPLQMWNLAYINERNLQRVASDCLLIMKNIQGEFNIRIRKIINLFFGKASELIHALKMIDSKMSQIVIQN